ncbi:hypothetical protein [Streptomyces qinglanensis]|uniref:hypothetical protein n=1 Tax=Streptomyces qinglanensis TaxID=943816 RepID=UPI003D7219BF
MGTHKLASRAALRAEVKHLTAEKDAQALRLAQVLRDFDAAAVELSGALEDRRAADERTRRLTEQLSETVAEVHRLQARLAECGAVTVPPIERDTSDPADVATHPVPIAQALEWPTLSLRVAAPKGATR